MVLHEITHDIMRHMLHRVRSLQSAAADSRSLTLMAQPPVPGKSRIQVDHIAVCIIDLAVVL